MGCVSTLSTELPEHSLSCLSPPSGRVLTNRNVPEYRKQGGDPSPANEQQVPFLSS